MGPMVVHGIGLLFFPRLLLYYRTSRAWMVKTTASSSYLASLASLPSPLRFPPFPVRLFGSFSSGGHQAAGFHTAGRRFNAWPRRIAFLFPFLTAFGLPPDQYHYNIFCFPYSMLLRSSFRA